MSVPFSMFNLATVGLDMFLDNLVIMLRINTGANSCKTHCQEFMNSIMCTRFRVFLRTLELEVLNVIHVVCACISLHNFLPVRKDRVYLLHGVMDKDDALGNITLG